MTQIALPTFVLDFIWQMASGALVAIIVIGLFSLIMTRVK